MKRLSRLLLWEKTLLLIPLFLPSISNAHPGIPGHVHETETLKIASELAYGIGFVFVAIGLLHLCGLALSRMGRRVGEDGGMARKPTVKQEKKGPN